MESETRLRLPIKDAQDIADQRGFDQVIIIARKVGEDGYEHVVTYGNGKAHCEAAARAGMAIKHHLMGWPHALFDSTLRVIGVGRDKDNPKALSVCLSESASDTDIETVHRLLSPPTKSPTEISKGE